MSLDKTMVQRVSQLARIEIEETQLETTARELNNILEWIEPVSYTHLTLPTRLLV